MLLPLLDARLDSGIEDDEVADGNVCGRRVATLAYGTIAACDDRLEQD